MPKSGWVQRWVRYEPLSVLRVPVSHRAVIAVDLNIRKYRVALVPWSDSLYWVSCDGISLILVHWFAKGSKAKTTSFNVLFSCSFATGESSFYL
jgi:hypothetical protein